MQNVLLVILLLLALALIIVVLMQRSEGGGLGMGGGGGNGMMSGRGAASALSKVTWVLAAAFLSLCVALTIIAARESGNASVLDRLGTELPADQVDTTLPEGLQGDLLPPSGGLELPPAVE